MSIQTRTGLVETESAVASRQVTRTTRYVASLRFDYIVTILNCWLISGMYLDGWAHQSIPQLESFFTPWHGVLYSGFAATAGYLIYQLIKNRRQGYAIRNALPAGYNVSMLGVLIFLSGGIGDGVGHTLFGIEKGIEGLISPTHLQLAFGGFLILTGPMRSLWQRTGLKGWGGLFPLIISTSLVLMVLNFFSLYANPLAQNWLVSTPPNNNLQNLLARGMSGILLHAALMMGAILLLVRYWRLPVGAIFTLVALPTVGISIMTNNWGFIPFAVVSGLLSEILFSRLQPSAAKPGAVRWLAFSLPVIFNSLFFLTIAIGSSIRWSLYIWTGSIVLSGVVGLLVSYLLLLPQPATATSDEV